VTYTGPGITTTGGNGIGILAQSGSGDITVNSSGPITTNGYGAHGIFATSSAPPGTVQVNAANVTTNGEFSTGVAATGGGNVTVNVASGASVMGGWQPAPAGVGSSAFALPAAGVVLGSTGATATLTNNGTIGALSDRAVASAGPGFAGPITIVNNGTSTGFVTLGAGNDTFQNLSPNSFDIRNFADTNGDGIRDTKAVAISDFGGGTDLAAAGRTGRLAV
jgi:hypothetical protein